MAWVALITFTGKMFAQVPEKCTDVMLQGFYWESQDETSWTKLNGMAEEIGQNFDLIWLPPSARASGSVGSTDVGYHPLRWSNQTSSWGYQDDLITLIASLKKHGCRSIADIVVNHRASKNGWCSFWEDDFGEYGTFQLTAEHICQNDEVNSDPSAGDCRGAATGAYDTGDNWDGARDLDHTSTYVQQDIEAYLKWMKNVIGYEGWRYDLVKGFSGKYVGMYNDASQPYLSVGEFWDGYDPIVAWIDATGKKSMAFDFPQKYALNSGLATGNYAGMAWMNMATNKLAPAGLIHSSYARYAVTFVDNHDTYKNESKYTGNVPQAYAFLLSAPGVPCVFWAHWAANKTAINNMIAARKSVGVHSQSACVVTNTSGYYESLTEGTCGTLICRIGSWNGTPDGYETACHGDGWAYYIKKTSDDCGGKTGILNVNFSPVGGLYIGGTSVALTATGANEPFTIHYTTDGTVPTTASPVYSAPISITSETTLKAIAVDSQGLESGVFTQLYRTEKNPIVVRAKNSLNWSNVYFYAWDKNDKSLLGEWPGVPANNDGDGWFSYSFDDADLVNVIFNSGTATGAKQTEDITNVVSSICLDILSTTTINSGGTTVQKTELTDCPATSIGVIGQDWLTVYPNPTDGLVCIDSQNVEKVYVATPAGNVLNVAYDGKTIDLTAYPAGIYFLTVIKSDNTTVKAKVFKK